MPKKDKKEQLSEPGPSGGKKKSKPVYKEDSQDGKELDDTFNDDDRDTDYKTESETESSDSSEQNIEPARPKPKPSQAKAVPKRQQNRRKQGQMLQKRQKFTEERKKKSYTTLEGTAEHARKRLHVDTARPPLPPPERLRNALVRGGRLCMDVQARTFFTCGAEIYQVLRDIDLFQNLTVRFWRNNVLQEIYFHAICGHLARTRDLHKLCRVCDYIAHRQLCFKPEECGVCATQTEKEHKQRSDRSGRTGKKLIMTTAGGRREARDLLGRHYYLEGMLWLLASVYEQRLNFKALRQCRRNIQQLRALMLPPGTHPPRQILPGDDNRLKEEPHNALLALSRRQKRNRASRVVPQVEQVPPVALARLEKASKETPEATDEFQPMPSDLLNQAPLTLPLDDRQLEAEGHEFAAFRRNGYAAMRHELRLRLYRVRLRPMKQTDRRKDRLEQLGIDPDTPRREYKPKKGGKRDSRQRAADQREDPPKEVSVTQPIPERTIADRSGVDESGYDYPDSCDSVLSQAESSEVPDESVSEEPPTKRPRLRRFSALPQQQDLRRKVLGKKVQSGLKPATPTIRRSSVVIERSASVDRMMQPRDEHVRVERKAQSESHASQPQTYAVRAITSWDEKFRQYAKEKKELHRSEDASAATLADAETQEDNVEEDDDAWQHEEPVPPQSSSTPAPDRPRVVQIVPIGGHQQTDTQSPNEVPLLNSPVCEAPQSNVVTILPALHTQQSDPSSDGHVQHVKIEADEAPTTAALTHDTPNVQSEVFVPLASLQRNLEVNTPFHQDDRSTHETQHEEHASTQGVVEETGTGSVEMEVQDEPLDLSQSSIGSPSASMQEQAELSQDGGDTDRETAQGETSATDVHDTALRQQATHATETPIFNTPVVPLVTQTPAEPPSGTFLASVWFDTPSPSATTTVAPVMKFVAPPTSELPSPNILYANLSNAQSESLPRDSETEVRTQHEQHAESSTETTELGELADQQLDKQPEPMEVTQPEEVPAELTDAVRTQKEAEVIARSSEVEEPPQPEVRPAPDGEQRTMAELRIRIPDEQTVKRHLFDDNTVEAPAATMTNPREQHVEQPATQNVDNQRAEEPTESAEQLGRSERQAATAKESDVRTIPCVSPAKRDYVVNRPALGEISQREWAEFCHRSQIVPDRRPMVTQIIETFHEVVDGFNQRLGVEAVRVVGKINDAVIQPGEGPMPTRPEVNQLTLLLNDFLVKHPEYVEGEGSPCDDLTAVYSRARAGFERELEAIVDAIERALPQPALENEDERGSAANSSTTQVLAKANALIQELQREREAKASVSDEVQRLQEKVARLEEQKRLDDQTIAGLEKRAETSDNNAADMRRERDETDKQMKGIREMYDAALQSNTDKLREQREHHAGERAEKAEQIKCLKEQLKEATKRQKIAQQAYDREWKKTRDASGRTPATTKEVELLQEQVARVRHDRESLRQQLVDTEVAWGGTSHQLRNAQARLTTLSTLPEPSAEPFNKELARLQAERRHVSYHATSSIIPEDLAGVEPMVPSTDGTNQPVWELYFV